MSSIPLAQTSTTASGSAIGALLLVYLVVFIFYAACYWKIFTKAGQEGWKAIIPFYNLYIACKIVGRSPWLWLLIFIPFVGALIFAIIISIDLAKCFDKSTG